MFLLLLSSVLITCSTFINLEDSSLRVTPRSFCLRCSPQFENLWPFFRSKYVSNFPFPFFNFFKIRTHFKTWFHQNGSKTIPFRATYDGVGGGGGGGWGELVESIESVKEPDQL